MTAVDLLQGVDRSAPPEFPVTSEYFDTTVGNFVVKALL